MGDGSLASIDLYDSEGALTAEALERHLASRDASRVRELTAYLHFMDDACRAVLGRSPFVAELERLRLSANAACNQVTAAAFVAFLEQVGGGLRRLEVSGLAMGDAGASAIASHASAPELEVLVLDGVGLSRDGLASLLAVLCKVDWLDLASNRSLGPDGASMLTAWPGLVECRGLELGRTGLGDEGALTIAQAGPFARLEHLGLRSNELGDAAARAIVTLRARELRHLDVSYNRIEAAALEALAAAWPEATVETRGNATFEPEFAARLGERLTDARLSVEDQFLEGSPELHTLLHWPRLAEVRHLELISSPIALSDLAELLAKPALGALETLLLRDTIAGGSGNALIGILASAGPRSLRHLGLEHVFPRLDDKAIDALLRLPFFDGLDSLGLAGSLEGSPSALDADRPNLAFRALCAHDGPFVKRLGLRYLVGDREVKSLVKAPWFPTLTHLDLSGGNVGAYGLYLLLRALADSRIESVDLSENCAGDARGGEVEAKKVWDDMRPAAAHVRIKEPRW